MLLFRIRKGALWGALVLLFGLNTYGVVTGVTWCAFAQLPITLLLAVRIFQLSSVRPIANHRALKLLFTHLSPEQRREFIWRGRFHVRGSDGAIYQIKDRSWDNVRDATIGYCCAPIGVPRYDRLLAQKLLIETNVRHFQVLANMHYLTNPKEL